MQSDQPWRNDWGEVLRVVLRVMLRVVVVVVDQR